MYELFNTAYVQDLFEEEHLLPGEKINSLIASIGSVEFKELLKQYEGASFNKGAYRIINSHDISLWINCIGSIFPDFSKRIVPFGYDWLGRFFCLDLERIDNSKPLVLLFSGFTNEVMEIPANILEFHDKILIEEPEGALELKMFSNFMSFSRVAILSTADCVDMVLPLYTGGTYTVDNMKLAKLTTSWEINAQFLSQLKTVQEGTRINKVTIR